MDAASTPPVGRAQRLGRRLPGRIRAVLSRLSRLGLEPDQILVLYAPTWGDTGATSAWTAKLFDGLDLEALAARLGEC